MIKKIIMALALTGITIIAGCSVDTANGPVQAESISVEVPTRPRKQTVYKPAVEAPSSVKCMTDSYGNTVKAIVASANTAVLDASGKIVETPKLMDKLYVHTPRISGTVSVSKEPRLEPFGFFQNSKGLCITGNMQAVRLNRATRKLRKPVVGFRSQKDLERYLNGEPISPVFVESESALGRQETWLPILQRTDVEVGGRKIDLLEVAGWTIDIPQPRRLTHHQQQKLKSLSLVLCLDATGSMSHAIESLQTYLNKIIQMCFDSGFKAELALVLFRDDDEGSEWTVKKTSFTSEKLEIQRWLNNVTVDGGGDPQELMLAGLGVATDMLVEEARDNSFKCIIIAGDNASKVDGDGLIGALGESSVKKCRENGIRISTLQIPLDGGDGVEEGAICDDLKRQFERLAEPTCGTSLVLRKSNTQEIAGAFKRLFNDAFSDAKAELEVAEQMAAGKDPKMIRREMDLPESTFDFIRANVKRRVGRIAITENKTLGVDRIWIPLDTTDWDVGVMIHKNELGLLRRRISQLLDAGLHDPKNIVKLASELAQRQIGDSDMTIADEMRMQGIPVNGNGLLSLSLAEIAVMSHQQRTIWQNEVEKKSLALAQFVRKHPARDHHYVIPIEIMP